MGEFLAEKTGGYKRGRSSLQNKAPGRTRFPVGSFSVADAGSRSEAVLYESCVYLCGADI